MKGDFTRSTFRKTIHYSSVRMQQGRVQLDADWNEQADITAYRTETCSGDIIGLCGTPMHEEGFELTVNGPDILIGQGRYYVDGILCENEDQTKVSKQTDLPENHVVMNSKNNWKPLKQATKGTYMAYLDVWNRHITAIEDDHVREKALDGPDTATRTKTVWQVKLLKIDDNKNCISALDDNNWKDIIAGSSGKLNVKVNLKSADERPCIVSPEAAYRRLENQLYRIEVHDGGLRDKATFKWSRDNGSIVAAIEKIEGKEVTLKEVGKDSMQGFASGQWVEILDDNNELQGEPGELVQIDTVDSRKKIITVKSVPAKLAPVAEGVDRSLNPKLRRWDQSGEDAGKNGIKMKSGSIDIEGGIAVDFENGTYDTGDYWLVPARTATGEIEWPYNGAQAPQGIIHHYCPLAVLKYESGVKKWTRISDCRTIFPPINELTNLLFVSGDGQEAMPGSDLPQPLVVRVLNGKWPVEGVNVEFTVSGGGSLKCQSPVLTTGPDGTAECEWTLGDTGKQQVTAVLLDGDGKKIDGQIIKFNANLSIASQVYYYPKACFNLQGDNNVQAALEKLSTLTKISHCGGDGQESLPGKELPQLLQVSVANKCGPVSGATVHFVADGKGRVAENQSALAAATSNTIDVTTGPDGIAACAWILDNDINMASQVLTATLTDAAGNPIQQPDFMRFTANLTLPGRGGCYVTVGKERGQYENLAGAFKEMEDDICICLLPGEHDIDDNIIEKKQRNVIRIIGCGAEINLKADTISLTADKIELLDLRLQTKKNNGRIVLAADEIAVDQCVFERSAAAEGPPLVQARPLKPGSSTVLHCKNNRISARWKKQKSKFDAEKYFLPDTGAPGAKLMYENMIRLSTVDPVINKKEYNLLLDETIEKMKKTDADTRKKWANSTRRRRRYIDKLKDDEKTSVYDFLDTVAAKEIDSADLREKLAVAMKPVYESGYAQALALSNGVGGWIEDNEMEGYVTLQYNEGRENAYLEWETGADEDDTKKRNANKRIWIEKTIKGMQYINLDDSVLNVRGNNFYKVGSNAPAIMKIIKSILKDGTGSLGETRDMGHKTINVTDNVFYSNNNSFICGILVMNGNQYIGAKQNRDVAVNVVGYVGTITGNTAVLPNKKAVIESIMIENPEEAANLLAIENF